MRKLFFGALAVLVLGAPASYLRAQESRERVDMDIVNKIRDEGMNRSQVMDTISYLTDVHGGRLTNSPEIRKAGEWTKNRLTEWKLENAHLEPWGPFGRGWSLERFSAAIVAPDYSPLIAYPKAWSPSTQKVVRGKPIYLDAKTEADLEKYRGKLHRSIVLLSPPREVKPLFDPPAQRQRDITLLNMANADPGARGMRGLPAPPANPQAGAQPGAPVNPQANSPEQRSATLVQSSKWQMIHEEGAALVLEPGRGDGGTVFVASAQLPVTRAPSRGEAGGRPAQAEPARRPSAWSPNAPEMVPQAVMAVEQYNRIVRMLQRDTPVELEFDIVARYHNDDLMSFNVVAEIPGTDLKDEVVMLGGHFDSWHAGTGATDNAAGCGVALEAVRILQAIGVKPRRTIRIALWTGEEEGLLGSRAYVGEHFGRQAGGGQGGGGNRGAQPERPSEAPAENSTAEAAAPAQGEQAAAQPPAARGQGGGGGSRYEIKPEHGKFAAYFNLDNGGGKIRGVYLQGNESVRPIFRAWLAPFADLGAQTLTLNNTSGTDHLSFDGVGLPGFQFIQDPLEYNTRTHHSSMDVYDRLVPDDMKQASVIMASFVYHAAMRDEKLPRKPLNGRIVEVPQKPNTTAQATPAAAAGQ